MPGLKQEIFDKVAHHLLTQKKASISLSLDHMGCVYRSESGLKCAIGCLIHDKDYSPDMESKPVNSLILNDKWDFSNSPLMQDVRFSVAANWASPSMCLLKDLQVLHDTVMPDQWHEKLSAMAIRYNLSDQVLGA